MDYFPLHEPLSVCGGGKKQVYCNVRSTNVSKSLKLPDLFWATWGKQKKYPFLLGKTLHVHFLLNCLLTACCQAGSVQWVYHKVFAEKNCLLPAVK